MANKKLTTTNRLELQTAFNEGITLLIKSGFGDYGNEPNKITNDAMQLANLLYNVSCEKFWKEFKQSVNNQI